MDPVLEKSANDGNILETAMKEPSFVGIIPCGKDDWTLLFDCMLTCGRYIEKGYEAAARIDRDYPFPGLITPGSNGLDASSSSKFTIRTWS